MKKNHIFKLCFFICIIILLFNVLNISKDYQDSWILEDFEISYLFFLVFYITVFSLEKKSLWLVILAILGKTFFLLIPNLKYVWFLGPHIDPHIQYSLAKHLYSNGHISNSKTFTFSHYTETPLYHLTFTILSIMTKYSIVDSIKYIPLIFSILYILLVYIVIKKINYNEKNTVLTYALFIASIPFTPIQYIITGSLFGIIISFLILITFILIIEKNDRRYFLIYYILVSTLAAAHSISSLILIFSLFIIMILKRILQSQFNIKFLKDFVLLGAFINTLWFVFKAKPTLREINRLIFFAVPTESTPQTEYIPVSFFEHLRINLLSAIKSFSVLYGADAFYLVLMFASLLLLLKKKNELNKSLKFILIYGWVILILMVIGYSIKLGIGRAMHFARLFYPIFSSIFLVQTNKFNKKGKMFSAMLIIIIIIFSTIELYRCQPIVPSANVLYNDIPKEVPIGEVGLVNSIYQRKMIKFIELYSNNRRIACTKITKSQVIGLTKITFSTNTLVNYNPLDKSQKMLEHDYFMLNLPGKSGILSVDAKFRIPSLIKENIYNSSSIYSNGESYILITNLLLRGIN